jgi:single-strand DNA-binding protein
MVDTFNVTVVGRLVRDAELKNANNGMQIRSFTLASNTGWKKDSPATFFPFTMFGDRCNNLIELMKKGAQVCVVGTMDTNEWKDKEGKTVSKHQVLVGSVQILKYSDPESKAPTSKPESKPAAAKDDFIDDIPF